MVISGSEGAVTGTVLRVVTSLIKASASNVKGAPRLLNA
jgi:hypothetical protein